MRLTTLEYSTLLTPDPQEKEIHKTIFKDKLGKRLLKYKLEHFNLLQVDKIENKVGICKLLLSISHARSAELLRSYILKQKKTAILKCPKKVNFGI